MSAKTTSPSSSKKDSRSYFYAVGKRKTSTAQVRIYPKGKGGFVVNGRPLEEYFFEPYIEKILEPLNALGCIKDVDIVVKVLGGGVSSQPDAIRHGISRALILSDENARSLLKRSGFLRRDDRVKERYKFGKKGARKSPQWSKR